MFDGFHNPQTPAAVVHFGAHRERIQESDASSRGCMTHIVLSLKKPSGSRAVLLQDRAADVTPEMH